MQLITQLILAILLLQPSNTYSAETEAMSKDSENSASKVETIEVVGQRIRKFSKDMKDSDIAKTELLDGESMRRHGSQTLADAIKQARGIDTQLFCANCGAKRISINGLRGEHTTILIDGFPLHSTVSSFYGIDAVPMIGIDRIEVNRGAGSSLTNPESVGGSINLVTAEPLENRFTIRSELGSEGSRQTSFLSAVVANDTAFQVMGFDAFSPHWDEDANGLAESPERKNQAFTLQLQEQLTDKSLLKLRYSESDLLIIGGNTESFIPDSYSKSQARPEDFVGNDVRNLYVGRLEPITEAIDLFRREVALNFDHELDADSQLSVLLSSTRQEQKGIYSHAFDYDNVDKIEYGAVRFRRILGLDHLLTIGIEAKDQKMNSNSLALFIDRIPPLPRDSFRYENRSFYLMDEWQASDRLSLSLAARFDQIDVQWLELGKSLKDSLIAPRLLALYEHSPHISSRLALGTGYRPPLTLFESQHGSSHDGFELDIKEIEKSQSAVLTYSMNYPSWFSTWSWHYTKLINTPYAIDRTRDRQPLLFVNAEENFDVQVLDWFFGGKSHNGTEWQVGVERYFFNDSYASKLPTAAIEFRAQLDLIQETFLGLTAIQAIYVGERDLSRYGYDNHYNVYDTDITSETFGEVSLPKKTKVPAYTQINLSHEINLNSTYSLKMRIQNLTDFTQASVDDTPATWHWHETHAHFDNFHTWGPNQGREFFIELGANL